MTKLTLAIFLLIPRLVWACPDLSGSFKNEVAKFEISSERFGEAQEFHIVTKGYGLSLDFKVIPDGEYREVQVGSGFSMVSVAARCKEDAALEVSLSDKSLKKFRVLTFVKESDGSIRFVERQIEFLNDWTLEKVIE